MNSNLIPQSGIGAPLRLRIALSCSSTPLELTGNVSWSQNGAPIVAPFHTIKDLKLATLHETTKVFTTNPENSFSIPSLTLIFAGKILEKDSESVGEALSLCLSPPDDVNSLQERLVTIHAIYRGVLNSICLESKDPPDSAISCSTDQHLPIGDVTEGSEVSATAEMQLQSVGSKLCSSNSNKDLRTYFHSTHLPGNGAVPSAFSNFITPECLTGEQLSFEIQLQNYLESYENYVANYYQKYYQYQLQLLLHVNEAPLLINPSVEPTQSGVPTTSSTASRVTAPESGNAIPNAAQPRYRRLVARLRIPLPRMTFASFGSFLGLALKWSFFLFLITQNASYEQTIGSGICVLIFFLGQVGVINWRRIREGIRSLVEQRIRPSTPPAPTEGGNNQSIPSGPTSVVPASPPESRLRAGCRLVFNGTASFLVTLFPGSHPLDPATVAAEHIAAAEEMEAAAGANGAGPGFLG
jgi:hypothetical protein